MPAILHADLVRRTPCSPLSQMLLRIDTAMNSNNRQYIDRILADILAMAVIDPDLLAGHPLAPSIDRYARHLLHAGDGYTLLALVWLPGQQSPVHSHRTWCALAVHEGWLRETLYLPGHPVGERALYGGDVSHAPPDLARGHRMANVGSRMAISLHIYGAPYDRLGQDVNHIWPDHH